MDDINEYRLLCAAKASIALLSTAFETLWSLYPDEMLALKEQDEVEIVEALKRAARRSAGAPMSAPDALDPEDIF